MQERVNILTVGTQTIVKTSATVITNLKPSALGMKRLGFGGSLWQRGTLTGRGLFLGAGKKNTNA